MLRRVFFVFLVLLSFSALAFETNEDAAQTPASEDETALDELLDEADDWAESAQWATIQSISSKIGCTSETLRRWIQQAERENRELKRANEILRKASAFFAQAELDRPVKKW